MKLRKWMLAGLLIGILFVSESVAAHNFTARFPGGNDFYPRWAGARALLVEGRDPYSPGVTAEIQETLVGPDGEAKNSFSFAFPLHAIFLFWPLVYCSYDWARAIWMVMLQAVAVVTVIGLLRLARWRPSPVGLAGLLLATLFFYPVARTVILGQFTLHATLFLAAALLALQHGRDGWAGVWLAFASVKPQVVIFVAPWLVLWAVGQRRWRLVWGLLAGGGSLLLASLALFPRWPISFIEDAQRYSGVAGGRNPLTVLIGLAWPGGQSVALYGLAGILLLAMLAAWRRGWRVEGEPFLRAVYWAIVVGLLVPFQTGTTNQTILLIPLFDWLHRAIKQRKRQWALIVAGGSWVTLWALFLVTIKGEWENPIMFLPLPLLSLAVLVGLEVHS